MSCAFCASTDDVEEQQRLGVTVAVCRACTERFATPPTPPVVLPPPIRTGLPPTLGEHASAVVAQVARMAQLVAARTWTEQECSQCGATVHVYPDVTGGSVVLDKDPVLASSVPVALRWRVEDGRAIDVVEDDPDQIGARIRHTDVCGVGPEPDVPRLRQMWAARHVTS